MIRRLLVQRGRRNTGVGDGQSSSAAACRTNGIFARSSTPYFGRGWSSQLSGPAFQIRAGVEHQQRDVARYFGFEYVASAPSNISNYNMRLGIADDSLNFSIKNGDAIVKTFEEISNTSSPQKSSRSRLHPPASLSAPARGGRGRIRSWAV